MLVLGRRKSESVYVGHDIEVVVVEIRGEQVRLGFKAPDGISIHRSEIYQDIMRKAADKIAQRLNETGAKHSDGKEWTGELILAFAEEDTEYLGSVRDEMSAQDGFRGAA
tara:strand:- start:6749 stop:7078 length:330 start_codon:yes stop_codon:yes gene_type:complete